MVSPASDELLLAYRALKDLIPKADAMVLKLTLRPVQNLSWLGNKMSSLLSLASLRRYYMHSWIGAGASAMHSEDAQALRKLCWKFVSMISIIPVNPEVEVGGAEELARL
jgi:hypothetical protein